MQSVAVPAAALYRLGNELLFTVETSEPVLVTGTPTLGIVLGTGTVAAVYDPGASTGTQLVFRYAVQAEDRADGIGVGSLDLAGGAIRDAAGNDLDSTLQGVGDSSQMRVEGGSLLLHVDATGGDDASNGLAWDQALVSLATALAIVIPGDEIWVRAGSHSPGSERTDAFVLTSGVAVYGGFAGTENTRAERDAAANPTVLSAANPYHVLRNPPGIDETAILDGFTIAGGNADGGEPGGGMLNLGASPTIRNCHFLDNRGGALANLDGAAPLVEACTFSANLDGTAVLNQGSAPVFLNCTFTANPDGAVRNAAASPARFVHCTFSGNDGGALHDESELDPTLLNSILHDNGGGHGISGTIADGSILHCLVQGGGYGDGTCLDGDPRLRPLAANGGPVPTMAPGHLSAALGAASGGTATDARGEARPFGLAADLGAHEATVPLLVESSPASNATHVAIDASLTLAFQCPVTPAVGTNLLLRIVGGTVVETIPVTSAGMAGRTATFTFANRLDYATQYCIQLEAGAFTGSGGNPAIADETTLVFTTVDPPVYQVRFLADDTPGASLGGAPIQSIVLGQNATPVEALPPLGHHFVKWTSGGDDYSTENPLTVLAVAADMHLLAHFAPNTYTWAFHPGVHGTLDGGTPNVVFAVTFGEPAPAAPAVVPDAGYSHTGWSVGIPATVGLGDLEFAAQYAPNTYMWTFHPGAHGTLDGGTPNVVLAVTFGEPAPAAPAVVPDAGYSHTGWSADIPATVGLGDLEFTAQYAPNTYTWTFHPGAHGTLDGGIPNVVLAVTYGEPAPAAPVVAPEAGYAHIRWSADIPATVGLGDHEFTAQYAPNTYTWTFHPGAHGAFDGGTPNVVFAVTFGEPAPAAPAVVPDAGYSHTGWSVGIPATVGVGDHEFTAQYAPNTYTWAFHPGAHGTLDGGTPNVVLAVTFGEPAPAAPAVAPEAGYAHIGWSAGIPATVGVGEQEFTALYERIRHTLVVEHGSGGGEYVQGAEFQVLADERVGMSFLAWATEPPELAVICLADSGSPDTLFTMPGESVVLSATYLFHRPQWTVSVSLAELAVTTVTMGMHAAASDGFDPGLDADADEGTPLVLASDDLSRLYATELRPPAESADFLVVAKAGEAVARLSWTLDGLPAGKVLTVFRVHMDVSGEARTETPLRPFGNTARNMGTTDGIDIPAGETRGYVIRFADDQVHDLLIRSGWNLISLPVEPVDPRPENVLGGGAAAGVRADTVLGWVDGAYTVATEMLARIGYWVYSERDVALLVTGTPVVQEDLELLSGWNLRGSAHPRVLAPPARDGVTAWRWDPETLRYTRGGLLLPGTGYWFRVAQDTTVPLVEP